MNAKLTATLAVAALTTLLCAASLLAQDRVPRGDKRSTPAVPRQEVADTIARIEAQALGNVLLVECNNAFGYDTIQGAIDTADDGDVVVVLPRNAFGFECDGDAYIENINFLGKAITVQSLIPGNSDYVEATVIDGSGATQEDEQGSVVAFNHNEGVSSVLDGLTLTGGFGFRSPPHGYRAGGGIYCYEASPTIRNALITSNTAANFGGGIYCTDGSSPVIDSCRISSNAADNRGGGIYCSQESSPLVRNCVISDNVSRIMGGGVYLGARCDATIRNCTVENNSTGYYGGGISSTRSSPTISRCEILNNSADSSGGGIMLLYSSASTISDCVIATNAAGDSGGGIYLTLSSPTITNCTITGNAVNESGGGIFSARNSATISNSILWGNIAPVGSEIHLYYSRLHGEASELTLEYSDVQGGAGGAFIEDGSTLDWGCGNIDLDPGFLDPENGDYHIPLLSLARNAGDPDFVAQNDETDLDGDPRVQEGRVDMGADEYVLERPRRLSRLGARGR